MTSSRSWTRPKGWPQASLGLSAFPRLWLRDLLYGDPVLLQGLPSRLPARGDAHLRVDVGQVALDGRLREVKRGGYLVVGEPPCRQEQDLQFPGREDTLYPVATLLQHRRGHSNDRVLPFGVEDGRPHGGHEVL